MVEANRMTLQFFRQTCRLIPAMNNRMGNDAIVDSHKAKLNLAKWIRKGSNMRDPAEVTKTIRIAYDILFMSAYCEYESSYTNKYFVDPVFTYDGSKFSRVDKSIGLNLIDKNRFKGKSHFLKKFIKGTRPLLH